MTEDERQKIGTFRGIDMNINREKLQRMADEEGIELNFERWDELLRDIRIEESDDSNEKPNDSITKPKFVYNFDGQLIKTFDTTKECAEFFGVSREAVASYVWSRHNKRVEGRETQALCQKKATVVQRNVQRQVQRQEPHSSIESQGRLKAFKKTIRLSLLERVIVIFEVFIY